jgi:hypothetical protein
MHDAGRIVHGLGLPSDWLHGSAPNLGSSVFLRCVIDWLLWQGPWWPCLAERVGACTIRTIGFTRSVPETERPNLMEFSW